MFSYGFKKNAAPAAIPTAPGVPVKAPSPAAPVKTPAPVAPVPAQTQAAPPPPKPQTMPMAAAAPRSFVQNATQAASQLSSRLNQAVVAPAVQQAQQTSTRLRAQYMPQPAQPAQPAPAAQPMAQLAARGTAAQPSTPMSAGTNAPGIPAPAMPSWSGRRSPANLPVNPVPPLPQAQNQPRQILQESAPRADKKPAPMSRAEKSWLTGQQNQGQDSYKIQKGDTLSQLAQRYGTTTKALAEANKIKNPDLIYAGRSLNIPGMAQAGAAAPRSSKSSAEGLTQREGKALANKAREGLAKVERKDRMNDALARVRSELDGGRTVKSNTGTAFQGGEKVKQGPLGITMKDRGDTAPKTSTKAPEPGQQVAAKNFPDFATWRQQNAAKEQQLKKDLQSFKERSREKETELKRLIQSRYGKPASEA
jgi:LysM repeat protein